MDTATLTRMRLLIACAFLFFGSAAAQQPELAFKGLALGNSEDAVVKKYPRARCSGPPSTRKCSIAYTCTEADIMINSCLTLSTPQKTNTCLREASASLKPETVAGSNVQSIVFGFADGKLSEIYLTAHSRDFERIATAYTDVYGKPATDIETPVRNRAGATFQNREMTWVLPSGAVMITRYAANLDTSSVLYASPDGLRNSAEKKEAERRKAAGDI